MKHKMKRYNGEEGSKVEIDPEEAVNASAEAREITESVGTGPRNMDDVSAGQPDGASSSRSLKAAPKPAPKATLKPAAKAAPKLIAPSNIKSGRRPDEEAAKKTPVDVTKLSANERTKRNIEENLSGARSGSSPTDSRDVNARLRDSGIGSSISNYFSNFASPRERARREKEKSTKMASGGMTSSASKRADGIATKGKTRGKMC